MGIFREIFSEVKREGAWSLIRGLLSELDVKVTLFSVVVGIFGTIATYLLSLPWYLILLAGLSCCVGILFCAALLIHYTKTEALVPYVPQQKPVISFGGNLEDSTIANNIYGNRNLLLSVAGNVSRTTISGNRNNNDFDVLEFVVDSNILKITAEKLENTTLGATAYALYYSWNKDVKEIFDKIEGFSLKFYHLDIDTDGHDELIFEYHCGAHTKVLQIYKMKAEDKPKLIPSAVISSDWPDIYWQQGSNNDGTIITAKNRNWNENPIEDTPVIETYHVINGRCKKLNEQ